MDQDVPSGDPIGPSDPGASQALEQTEAIQLYEPATPRIEPDPGLYAVLGLDPSASDVEIQTTYRRQAARLGGGGSRANSALRQLNVAYEVLGNEVRRTEYDRMRQSHTLPSGGPTAIRPGAKSNAPVGRRRRPRQAVQPHYTGFSDVAVVLVVVGLAVLAGVLIVPRLSFNLSPLNALQGVLPLSNNASRRPADATAVPTPTAVPTATVRPAVADRFVGTTVSVSDPTPAQNAQESVTIKLRRDNQPAANFDAWATVQYSTTQERWPATGTVKTDGSGVATISFNVGRPLPGHEVQVQVFAQVDDQQLSWPAAFTPR